MQVKKNSNSPFTISTNSKSENNSILGTNITSMPSRTCITNKVYKNLSHITCFNYNKKIYYRSICTKFRKNYNTLKT